MRREGDEQIGGSSLSDAGVCVIIAAYNAEATIAKAVASALAQEHVAEVIVVDDASSDATASAARSADDGTQRLQVLEQTTNLGPAAARNRALTQSNSPYFCVLDADDYMLPDRMARLLSCAPGEWDLIADDLIILPDRPVLTFTLEHGERSPLRRIDLESFVLGNISRPDRPRHELGFLKPVVSRAFMSQHNLAYDEMLRLGEDYALYVRALIGGARFYLLSACGYVAVQRQQSLSSRHATEDLRQIVGFDALVLASHPQLGVREREALEKHRDATWKKFVYSAALDRKREKGIVAALAFLAQSSAAIPYVYAETIRAKTKTLRRRFGLDASQKDDQLRFLIDFPETRFSNIRPADDFGGHTIHI